ncbi:MAG: patatin-like phospholipase family protein [Acidobacteriota bacterium]
MSSSKNALVVEGGGSRGIFNAGVLDAFLTEGFDPFNIYIGVSAGAYCLASFLARMYQGTYRLYTDYCRRPEYINWWRFIRGGHLLDLDWLLKISNREMPLDLDRLLDPRNEYYIGVTDARHGQVNHIMPNQNNLMDLLKASMAIPLLYRKFVDINGMECVDGGLADPIPVRKAHELGASNIMVLRTRLHSYSMKPTVGDTFGSLLLFKHPALVRASHNRPNVYQESIAFIRNPPDGVRIIEINPPECFRTKRLTMDLEIFKSDYQLGYTAGLAAISRWSAN